MDQLSTVLVTVIVLGSTVSPASRTSPTPGLFRPDV